MKAVVTRISKNRTDHFRSVQPTKTDNIELEEVAITSIKKKILPLKTIYKKHREKLKNPESMMANKRLKRFKKRMKNKEQLLSSLFYDPFKPLNLKSRILTQYDKPFAYSSTDGLPALRRQNQINLKYFCSHQKLKSNPKFGSSKVLRKEVHSQDFKLHNEENDNDSVVSK